MQIILIYTCIHSHVISDKMSNFLTITYTLYTFYLLGGAGGDDPPTATTERQIRVATKARKFNPAIFFLYSYQLRNFKV